METNEVEMVFSADGKMRSIYKDKIQPVLSALGDPTIKRASDVEWERGKDSFGWTVRAHHDPELAIRVILEKATYRKLVSRVGELLYFNTREDALENELEFFWELLPTKEITP